MEYNLENFMKETYGATINKRVNKPQNIIPIGASPLAWWIKKGNDKWCEWLLNQQKINYHITNIDSWSFNKFNKTTVLIYAMKYNRQFVIDYILTKCKKEEEKFSTIICSICQDRTFSVDSSLKGCSHFFHKHCIEPWFHKFDTKLKRPNCPNCRKDSSFFEITPFFNHILHEYDEEGKTPLIISIQNKQYDIMKKLIHAKANIDSKDLQDKTALIHAAEKGNKEAIKLLIEHKADVNISTPIKTIEVGHELNYNGYRIVAMHSNYKINVSSIYSWALNKKVDMREFESLKYMGFSPLMFALSRGKVDSVKLLIEAGANIDHKNYYNEDCHDIAYDIYKRNKGVFKDMYKYVISKVFKN